MSPPSMRQLAGDGAQQGGFTRAVAADQADATPRIDRQVRAIQQRAAAHADDGFGNNQKGHKMGLAPSGAVRKHSRRRENAGAEQV